MDSRIQKRFDELGQMSKRIADSMGEYCEEEELLGGMRTHDGKRTRSAKRQKLDGPMFLEWQASVLSLLGRVFGNDHSTYQRFEKACEGLGHTLHSSFTTAQAIFQSAKSDFEGGYLFEIRNLVNADVFADELEQAEYFLGKGWKVPAAVIAGTVLESSLRELCNQHPDLQPSKTINAMNDDLARKSVYNKTRAEQVRVWAKIRNDAAHGNPDEFDKGDVTRMIDGIRDFVASQMN